MSGWGSGYVTDVTYMTGYYRHQSPSLLSLACLLGNVDRSLPGPDEAISYLELGCGQGFTALLLAASNPRWTVTAIDFHPAHVATAREWAAKAQLDNIRILEADLSTLAEDPAAAEYLKQISSACMACGAGCLHRCRMALSGCCSGR